MEQFEAHMKSIGYNDPALVKQFVAHRNAMRDSSGEHVPFAGIKRKVPAKRTSSALEKKGKIVTGTEK